MASIWSIPLAILIAAFSYFLVVLSWSGKNEIWALTPLVVLPFTHVVLPGLAGLGGIFIPKEKKLLNLIGFAFCVSALISPLFFIVLDELIQADTFIDIELKH